MQSLIQRGAVRIGTLFDYRNQDKHGEMTSDENEGVIKLTGNIISYDYTFFQHVVPEGYVTVTGEGENQLRHFKNTYLRTNDTYIFSTASTYSEEDHKKWFATEGNDACYQIHSARLFFRAVSKEFTRGELTLVAPVYYFDETKSNHVFTEPFHPALIKKEDFGTQSEVRAIWLPRNPTEKIDPYIVPKSDANRYCSPFRIIQDGKVVEPDV